MSDMTNGNIYTEEEIRKLMHNGRSLSDFVEMKPVPAELQLGRNPPRVGRNEPCPCGSGKKFKKCHWKGAPSVV